MSSSKGKPNKEWLDKLHAEGIISKKPSSNQDEPPVLFPDLFWIWEAYCFLSERRMAGNNGPQPISTADMLAYVELTGFTEHYYKRQLVRFVPILDRVFLKDFNDKQAAELKKIQSRSKKAK